MTVLRQTGMKRVASDTSDSSPERQTSGSSLGRHGADGEGRCFSDLHRMKRLEELRSAIRSGSYYVPADQIAASLLRFVDRHKS